MSEPQHEEQSSMSLGDHLGELRIRLILALAGAVAAIIIACFFGEYFVKLLLKPYEAAVKDAGVATHIQAIAIAEPFMVYMKAVVVLGLLIASPWIFYQFWVFVSAGLYRYERRWVYKIVPFCAFLFIAGAAFFLFVIAPLTIRFFVTFNLGVDYLQYNPRISDYIDLILILTLIFGLTFQIPLVIIAAEKLGLVTLETLKKVRKYVLLGVFVLAAMVTPSSDVVTQTALAVPLYVLYEGSIFCCGLKKKT